jgi:RNA-dependent RNA polymerase
VAQEHDSLELKAVQFGWICRDHMFSVDREHALVFCLNAPPSYEKEPVSGKRLKLSHLPIPDHERLAPFTLMAIRIVCCSQNDIRLFRKLCRIAHLNRVDEYDYPVDHRDLFALDDMIKVHDQLCRLPWIVAFITSKHGN